MAEGAKSFWQTAPGVITAVAALITALGGVLGILVQNGIIGPDSDISTQTTAPAVAGTGREAGEPGTAGGSPTPATDSPGLVPWTQAAAALVRRDGTSTTVKASTVGLACDTGNLPFENGQSVALELVRSIQFDAIYTESSSADGVVTLLDGRQLTDAIHTWNCPINGANDLGPVVVELEDIARIDFDR